MNQAFVLAAGFGTRLKPLTAHRPKPLVPVLGVPMLAYALALCAKHGLRRVVVNGHYLPEQLEPWAGEHEGVFVTLSIETPDILGTGGGLKHVAHQLDERFVVVNADVLNTVDLAALRAAVPNGGAAMALRTADADHYGVVAADSTHTLVELRHYAQAVPEGAVDRSTHFTGIHGLHRDALDRVPEGFACIVRTAYTELVPERRVKAIRHDGLWLDIGDPGAYLDANLALLRDASDLPLDPFSRAAYAKTGRSEHGSIDALGDATVEGTAWVGKNANLGQDVVLRDAVVGEGATVPNNTVLERCVVWDGATVPPGHHRDVIVHDGGVLQVTGDLRHLPQTAS